jgi:hypothetical protein
MIQTMQTGILKPDNCCVRQSAFNWTLLKDDCFFVFIGDDEILLNSTMFMSETRANYLPSSTLTSSEAKSVKNDCKLKFKLMGLAVLKVAPYNFWNMTKSWFRFNFLKRCFVLEDKNGTTYIEQSSKSWKLFTKMTSLPLLW